MYELLFIVLYIVINVDEYDLLFAAAKSAFWFIIAFVFIL